MAHNLASLETHPVGGVPARLCVHRKGATRALPPGHPELPADLRDAGQPVLIPGSMGTSSYVLASVPGGGAFASACHGAGRRMSRHQAARSVTGPELRRQLERQGIAVRGARGAVHHRRSCRERPRPRFPGAKVPVAQEHRLLAVAVQQGHRGGEREAEMLRWPTVRATRAARAVRGLWPDRNPLRRTMDRVEAMVAGGLVVAFLAGAPLAAVAAGHAVYGAGSAPPTPSRPPGGRCRPCWPPPLPPRGSASTR